jgi:hypothetical protein
MAMPDDAAYAPNWWRILLTDVALGVVAVLVGLNRSGGFLVLVPVGVAYIGFVVRRFFRWRRLRRDREAPG